MAFDVSGYNTSTRNPLILTAAGRQNPEEKLKPFSKLFNRWKETRKEGSHWL
jgi:hypothetical protein